MIMIYQELAYPEGVQDEGREGFELCHLPLSVRRKVLQKVMTVVEYR
jgi:hypothetical protein